MPIIGPGTDDADSEEFLSRDHVVALSVQLTRSVLAVITTASVVGQVPWKWLVGGVRKGSVMCSLHILEGLLLRTGGTSGVCFR
jgi:hypothetical protein